jgi:chitin synthase
LELFGTVALPSAIVLVFYLIFVSIFSGLNTVAPLILLAITLLLPGLLVLLTTKKPEYVLWMFVYLLSLPVWNFALPLYAFWHFDDFSWGDSIYSLNSARKVEGEEKGVDHSKRQGKYEIGSVQLKR